MDRIAFEVFVLGKQQGVLRPSKTKTTIPTALYILLCLYIGIVATYEVVALISTATVYFNLRDQVVEPFRIERDSEIVPRSKEALSAGLSAGDIVLSINGRPFTGQALWQRIRWYAQPGDTLEVTVRKLDGRQMTAAIRLSGYLPGYTADRLSTKASLREEIFTLVVAFCIPIVCLVLGIWVTAVRPHDPNAWLILVLLTYPQSFNPVGTFDWVPQWLVLRLSWHLVVQILAPGALLLLGLRFPERARFDVQLPWLKWLIAAILTGGLIAGLISDYNNWYNLSLLRRVDSIDRLLNPTLIWTWLFCIAMYWIIIVDKLRTATSPDSRRRLQVLLVGSIVGLGSILLIWGLLPLLGIADPANSQLLVYLSAVLMLFFPLSLAYVVVVQRALDVRILVRIGTKYVLARATLNVIRLIGLVAIVWFVALPLFTHPRTFNRAFLSSLFLLASALLFFKKKSPTDLIGQWIDRRFFRDAYNAENTLAKLAQTARTISDPAVLIQTVSDEIANVLHVDQITVSLCHNGVFKVAYAIGQPFGDQALRILADSSSFAPMFTDQQISTEDLPELLLPLPGRTQLVGAMALGPKRSEAPYTPSDLRLFESVSVQTGLGLELSSTAELLAHAAIERANAAREMEIAREVQERLFPQAFPVIPGVTLGGTCRTVFGIGGDYYDAFDLGNDSIALAIGDVSGKGISAALLMSSLRACLRTLSLDESGDLTTLMSNLNRLIYEASAVNRYATFFLAVYDTSSRRLRYVNAGHNPPALIRSAKADQCLRLSTGGPVVGLLPDVIYEEDCLELRSGDALVTFTDGISEAMTSAEEEWGENSLILTAEQASNRTAEEIVQTIFQAADAYTGDASQHDDMTVLVMKLS